MIRKNARHNMENIICIKYINKIYSKIVRQFLLHSEFIEYKLHLRLAIRIKEFKDFKTFMKITSSISNNKI